MLVNTHKKDKKGNLIYQNALNGKSRILDTARYSRTKKTIPAYAFGFIYKGYY